jgi:hypothetical protein
LHSQQAVPLCGSSSSAPLSLNGCDLFPKDRRFRTAMKFVWKNSRISLKGE